MTTIAVTMLMVGVVTGAAGAYTFQLDRTLFNSSGLFTIEANEAVNINALLEEAVGAPSARVLLRLLDTRGAVVARKDVVLEPGQSTTLTSRLPGVFRAQVQVVEPDLPFGKRRRVVNTIEIFDIRPTSLDLTSRRRFVCSSDDGAGSGRLPD
jgi:hypothetical protein